jgi:hypothetical protein
VAWLSVLGAFGCGDSVDRDVDPAREPITCRLIGCSNSLEVDLPGARDRFAGAYPIAIEACHDGSCSTWTLSDGMSACEPRSTPFGNCWWTTGTTGALVLDLSFDDPQHTDGGAVHAEVTVRDSLGQIIFEGIGDASLSTARQPNGPGCPPICYSGRVVFSLQ